MGSQIRSYLHGDTLRLLRAIHSFLLAELSVRKSARSLVAPLHKEKDEEREKDEEEKQRIRSGARPRARRANLSRSVAIALDLLPPPLF